MYLFGVRCCHRCIGTSGAPAYLIHTPARTRSSLLRSQHRREGEMQYTREEINTTARAPPSPTSPQLPNTSTCSQIRCSCLRTFAPWIPISLPPFFLARRIDECGNYTAEPKERPIFQQSRMDSMLSVHPKTPRKNERLCF